MRAVHLHYNVTLLALLAAAVVCAMEGEVSAHDGVAPRETMLGSTSNAEDVTGPEPRKGAGLGEEARRDPRQSIACDPKMWKLGGPFELIDRKMYHLNAEEKKVEAILKKGYRGVGGGTCFLRVRHGLYRYLKKQNVLWWIRGCQSKEHNKGYLDIDCTCKGFTMTNELLPGRSNLHGRLAFFCASVVLQTSPT